MQNYFGTFYFVKFKSHNSITETISNHQTTLNTQNNSS